MEDSFFEYRDKTAMGSDSDSEIIDNSFVMNANFSSKKKPAAKNKTVFVAESEDSCTDEDDADASTQKIVPSRSHISDCLLISSSEDDASKRSSMRRQLKLEQSFHNVVLGSSSGEDDVSPEILPKRRPPMRPKSKSSSDSSIIGRKPQKRIIFDSEADNSIVIEQDKHNKVKCLQDTPLAMKIDNNKKAENRKANLTSDHSDVSSSDDSDDEEKVANKNKARIRKGIVDSDQSDSDTDGKINNNKNDEIHKGILVRDHSDGSSSSDDDDKEKFVNKNKVSIRKGIADSDMSDCSNSDIDVKKNWKIRKANVASDQSDGSSDEDADNKARLGEETVDSDEIEGSNSDRDGEINYKNKTSIGKANRVIIQSGVISHKNKYHIQNDIDKATGKAVCSKITPPPNIDNVKKAQHETSNHSDFSKHNDDEKSNDDDGEESEDDDGEESEDDDGPDEDLMVMSRATRMSIMGMIPKDNDSDSDDSDFIQSDDKSKASSSSSSLSGLPDPGELLQKTSENPTEPNLDSSRISCSPFGSPLQDISSEINNINYTTNTNAIRSNSDNVIQDIDGKENDKAIVDKITINKKSIQGFDDDDVTFVDTTHLKNNVLNYLIDEQEKKRNVKVIDEDVTIIETKPEIIALSSDDENEDPKKSTNSKKSPKTSNEASTSAGGSKGKGLPLVPASYPNQQVVYVKRHVRDNELAKLEGLREDLKNITAILEEMDMDSLPDGGVRLIERLTAVERQVREQGEKVANMVVETELLSPEAKAKEAAEVQPSWDDLQKGSNAVQPRMFGHQAMATHMAERNLIMETLRNLYESLGSRPPESQQASAPGAVRSKLMPHQLHALAFLHWRETQRPCGGILADDMGLGKTITMISLILSDKQSNIADEDDEHETNSKLVSGGTLVVCPASLLQQWAGEVSKHCAPHAASVHLHHGTQRAQHAHRLATYDLVLTTYNLLQRDHLSKGVLTRVQWRRVILDEAHIVRNHKSATSTAVSALHGRRRWCLTGTPVQNKDLDLFALLKFLRCTPFNDFTMWKKWIDNKALGGQERLCIIMRSILLRRTKTQLQQQGQLACLPERIAHLMEVTLSKEEMNVYQQVLVLSKTLFAQFLHQRAEKQADGQGFLAAGKDTAYAKMHKRMVALQGAKPVKSHEILVLLLRLRQVCCHCGLIASMLDEETREEVTQDVGGQDLLAELNKLSLQDSKSKRKSGKQDEDDENDDGPEQEGATVTEAIRSVLSLNNPVFQLTRMSSKIKAVMDCLRKNVFAKKDEKAVVVSQWTSVLFLVQEELKKAHVRHVTLSGSVPVPARAALVDALNQTNSPVQVMLLSLSAGGVGLNLCGANHLLLLDPHWNPQLEEQAQDRIYRVGQTRNVHIYRFMCVDTVEQSIRKLQQEKLDIADNVLTGARNNNASKVSIQDLKLLFNMGQ